MREQPNKTKGEASATTKKPYRAPRLTVYGDLRTITKAKGGSSNDGALPKTKK
jgi:hypothetical protein